MLGVMAGRPKTTGIIVECWLPPELIMFKT